MSKILLVCCFAINLIHINILLCLLFPPNLLLKYCLLHLVQLFVFVSMFLLVDYYPLKYFLKRFKEFSVSQCGICIPQCEICIPHCGFCISQCETENLLWNFSFYIMRMIRNEYCYLPFICFSFCGYKERKSFVLNKNVYIIVINCFVSVWYLLHLPLNIIK